MPGCAPPATKLKEFRDPDSHEYVTITHSRAGTSNEIAALSHAPGKEVAKVRDGKVDGEMAVVRGGREVAGSASPTVEDGG